jgi:tetratricopeptide (TPR) repeat protein
LIRSYTAVRDFDKARALADRGLTLLRKNPAGDKITRLSVESGLYATLGNDLVRRREYDKAIDNLERAVDLQRSDFADRNSLSRIFRSARVLAENSEIALTRRLIDLARAYTLLSRFDDALESYSEASKHISYGGTRVIEERAVYSVSSFFSMRQKRRNK